MTQSEQIPPSDQAAATEPIVNARNAGHSRRVFLFKLSLLVNGAVGVFLGVPIIGYLLGPALKNGSGKSWINLGPLNNFPVGETRLVNFRNPVTTSWDGQTGDIPCWVRRISDDKFQVFAINCAHLGCPVRWFAQSRLFLCPCHGGAYYADGARASGPPERGLFEYDHKIAENALMIHVGRMPTLASQARVTPPLTQLEVNGPAARLAAVEQPKPRCSSCQT
jgi:menaquinol-cytochrome c reductase iron-sulfur subunit